MDHDVGLDGSWLEERCEMSGKPPALAGSARRPGVGIRDLGPGKAPHLTAQGGGLDSRDGNSSSTALLLFVLTLVKLGYVADGWPD
ncbi:unnamed protein product [Clonostachys rosea]|uniref:Uncharacterized protein n=1 Tax=Bionectria ochroleuca TaxID=29856 RepID=A0ABY6V5I7_BIOOC|nr:unnamed protein product [Clonostachys rosea]